MIVNELIEKLQEIDDKDRKKEIIIVLPPLAERFRGCHVSHAIDNFMLNDGEYILLASKDEL